MVPSLKEHFDGYDFANHLPEIKTLLESAQTEITFWGERVITIPNYEGSLSLHEVTRRIINAADTRYNTNLTFKERVAGQEIMDKMRNFYNVSWDTQFDRCNWFTKILFLIRECIPSNYHARSRLSMGWATRDLFRVYSQEEYAKVFGAERADGTLGDDLIVLKSRLISKLALEE